MAQIVTVVSTWLAWTGLNIVPALMELKSSRAMTDVEEVITHVLIAEEENVLSTVETWQRDLTCSGEIREGFSEEIMSLR